MPSTYHNPWIPAEARRILAATTGAILDVGGGAPYVGATHILDIWGYDAEDLLRKCWGGTRSPADVWTREQHTQFDLLSGKAWPFSDKQFDLGLCSHTLEDLTDPLPAVAELSRVCHRVLIICPSRLIEQTKGISHPRVVGFSNHHWIVFEEGGVLVFRRKTPAVNERGAHLTCPLGMTLRLEDGCMFCYGPCPPVAVREFPSHDEDFQEYRRFRDLHARRKDLFIHDDFRHDARYWCWRLRQKLLGHA